jgi:hypothetical protein
MVAGRNFRSSGQRAAVAAGGFGRKPRTIAGMVF